MTWQLEAAYPIYSFSSLQQIDDSIGNYVDAQKRNWVLQFQSEFELGKFEQKIFAAWHSLYQVKQFSLV